MVNLTSRGAMRHTSHAVSRDSCWFVAIVLALVSMISRLNFFSSQKKMVTFHNVFPLAVLQSRMPLQFNLRPTLSDIACSILAFSTSLYILYKLLLLEIFMTMVITFLLVTNYTGMLGSNMIFPSLLPSLQQFRRWQLNFRDYKIVVNVDLLFRGELPRSLDY